jgi:hypothetical protein
MAYDRTMKITHTHWMSADEELFVEKIGTWSISAKAKPWTERATKIFYLKKYIEAAPLREATPVTAAGLAKAYKELAKLEKE